MKKEYKPREFDKLLRKNGWTYNRSKGDHHTYKRGNRTLTYNVRQLKWVVTQRLIKEYELVV